MLAEERRLQIVSELESHGSLTVKELASRFNVGVMTIRRDLAVLEQQGLAIRTHGGAMSVNNSVAMEVPYIRKAELNQHLKRRIGAAAAAMIQRGETLILDAGSTTFQVALHLPSHADLTVVSNDLKILTELCTHPSVTVISTGGIVNPAVYTMIGPQVVAMLSTLHVDRVFLGADAVSLEAGITNRTYPEVSVKQAMIECAREVVLVCDSTKFGKQVFAQVCPLTRVNTIITDANLDSAMSEAIRELGINLHLV